MRVLVACLSGVGALSVALSQRLRANTRSPTGVLLITIGLLGSIVAVQSSTPAVLIMGAVISGAGFEVPAIVGGFLVAPLGLNAAVVIYASVIVAMAVIGGLVRSRSSSPRRR